MTNWRAMMKNRRVRQMMVDVYGVDFDFWENKKVSDNLWSLDLDDCGFFNNFFQEGVLIVASLTADQLRGIK
ncbi:hypothetical protein NVP1113A_10 [Vibrio phage 1.113.A._10N.286.51.E7]|nr:hypothetical protein NVP1113A_10 [Vibrio phage 1.113.A._10N.286.51.E7]